MRIATCLALAGLLQATVSSAAETYEPESYSPAISAELKVEILSPAANALITGDNRTVTVEGGASSFGGIRHLDLVFVLDSSKSLRRTDPQNFLSAGAVNLIENFSPKSDIQIGVVSFSFSADLLQPMTTDRAEAIGGLKSLKRDGGTDIADGVEAALVELDANARPDSTRVIMLFTDGKSSKRKARKAMENARQQGVAVHTLLLGDDEDGAEILREIARGTGGSFVQVTDPAMLPDAFLNLRTTGVDAVAVQVNGEAPVPARLAGGNFLADVTLKPGENRITAVATGLDGSTATSEIMVNSGPPNCAALELTAFRNGLPASSIEDRAVEIVIDASRSMWGRMEGEPKMTVAKQTLLDVSQGLNTDSYMALRAYGSNSNSELKDCNDSELLVEFGDDNREQIKQAIQGLRPTGQTPLAYALNQAGRDFEGIEGEKALVLVTDGIESCGGDPVTEAGALREMGIPIHVIGFGMGSAEDEDTASLDAIAQAGEGQFFLAGSSDELKDALASTVGTPYKVYDGIRLVASGVLGSDKPILLPEGQYVVELESSPPREFPVMLVDGERMKLTLQKEARELSQSEQRQSEGYIPCPMPEEAEQSVAGYDWE